MGANMKTQTKPKNTTLHRNQRGQALFETIPLLVIFITILDFAMGMYGAIQSAILYSIAARTYSFESYRQRANLYYFREDGTGATAGGALNYTKKGWRYQAINSATDTRLLFVPTTRWISFGTTAPQGDNTEPTNNQAVYGIGTRNQKISANPIWIMVGYGICLNMQCGN